MLIDCVQEIGAAPVMEEKQSLADAPQRSGAKFVRPGGALDDVVSEPRTHVVHEEIGEQIYRPILQNRAVHGRRGPHLRRVTQGAADIIEDTFAALCALARIGIRLRRIREPHQELELHPIRHDV
jgi:hypothetical protein